MKKVRLYIEKGVVVANPDRKPEPMALPSNANHELYSEALQQWQDNNIEVENIVSMRGRMRLKIYPLYYTLSDIRPGQSAWIDGRVITKLNQ